MYNFTLYNLHNVIDYASKIVYNIIKSKMYSILREALIFLHAHRSVYYSGFLLLSGNYGTVFTKDYIHIKHGYLNYCLKELGV